MAGLDPAIHDFLARGTEDVDARLKAGHESLVGKAQLFPRAQLLKLAD
jgi:hypothetical protein